MVVPSVGAIVLPPFPFSDLSGSKLRPGVVLAEAGRGDWIFCQVTSNPYADSRAVRLLHTSFRQGGLRLTSYARPGKLFTAKDEVMVGQVGDLNPETLRQIIDAVIKMLLPA